MQPTVQVCEGDTIEFAVNFLSMQGMLDVDSVEWFDPYLSPSGTTNVLNYDKDAK